MKTKLLTATTTVLVWAAAVFAHPSHPNSVYGVIPRDQNPNDADALLGINCRGSALCSLPSCTVSLATIKKYVDTLDDKEEWGNGDQIVCNLCPGCSPLSANCAGICAFPQKLKTDEKVNGSLIKSKINDLVNHKCGRCGSCPTKPGNDVNTGEITVNYVTSGCKEGVCDYKRKTSRDEVASSVTADQTADEDAPVDQTIDTDVPADQTIDVDDPIDTSLPPGTSENVHALGAPRGINCKGSSFCKTCGDKTIERILRSIDLMDQDWEFTNNQHIVCEPCEYGYTYGMCIFPRNLHRPIAVKDVKVLVKRLLKHGCEKCGSIPLHEGSENAQGMLTSNYMQYACPGKNYPWGCGPNPVRPK
ncbi:killer toxin Kp4/SMK [Alternaria rosae]|uniref:killer toxin Kp4/SMK n=1 Tax=Alternaria rosae TaxID=1187941 RepID=UPI001E8DE683|nr:killer toxin Kp4/SMK [Alternaria rosae]KAH6878775.1 killer toxin Kp4/SMK [Alternaria rosae]